MEDQLLMGVAMMAAIPTSAPMWVLVPTSLVTAVTYSDSRPNDQVRRPSSEPTSTSTESLDDLPWI